jgi:3D (Asp-Asp-Asp) domain-containing protein
MKGAARGRNTMNRARQLVTVLGVFGALLAVAAVGAAGAALDLRARPGALDRAGARAAPLAAAARSHPIKRPTWLSGVTVSEYYSVPEAFFRGARIRAPGIPGLHRIDWLYSARGLTMEGDGVGLDGRRYHVDDVGRGGWIDPYGRPAAIGGSREVFWRAGGYYRNSRGWVTFPLDSGASASQSGGSLASAAGWYDGVGVQWIPLPGVRFAPGSSLPLTYYRSIAVDPRLIPLGSRVYIPYYRHIAGGWFVAQDTGGGILGRHVDVYRPPPATLSDEGRYLVGQRIYVVPPRRP